MFPQNLLHILGMLPSALACVHGATPSYNFTRRGNATVPPLKKIAIENVRVFDGFKLEHPRRVIIDRGYISDDPSGIEEVVEGNGKVLIPGLMDSHLHATSVSALEELSSYGVTTAFNMNCYNYTACDILRDQPGLTSAFFAGIPAVGPGSNHERLLRLPDSLLVNSSSQAPEFVSWAFGNNSDYYKIISEPDGCDQGIQNALVEAAHRRGKKAMTHSSYLEYFKMAVKSGSDGLQHTVADGLVPESTIQQIRAQGQYVTPTLTIFYQSLKNASTIEFLTGEPTTNQTVGNGTMNTAAMHKAGVPLLAGTDAIGVIPPIDTPFGLSLHWELEHLVEIGMTPAEALRAATIVPAFWHGHEDRGAILPGKRADLVLLNSNPLENITNTRDISKVWIGGIEYKDVVSLS
ncbi:uncharacterized protein TRUGW13939_08741 [Talaromyces rugulosus]|uniref:Amidohydrolase-related domain-containing protein n=1 Tax=Talaromyces rugulosus TaxID=121627 RepID=A0A7H8R5D3_TALRU|nr:uncharacterized protein TRUGW13939_08741 [Talaromyces rugulosus]QKX61589.1 hypothetical protein TRUGW13939_08741 [Talaromyces rugulosus]